MVSGSYYTSETAVPWLRTVRALHEKEDSWECATNIGGGVIIHAPQCYRDATPQEIADFLEHKHRVVMKNFQTSSINIEVPLKDIINGLSYDEKEELVCYLINDVCLGNVLDKVDKFTIIDYIDKRDIHNSNDFQEI